MKKAISPVVATALLLVVAVVAVIGFQGWFGSYSSDLFVKTEKDSQATSQTNIETLIGDQLYFKNTFDDNVTIKQIKLGNRECNISLNVSSGFHNISLGNCVDNLTLSDSIGDITVITDKQIYTKKYLFKDVSIASASQSLNPVIENQIINNSLLFDGVDDYLSWTPTQEGNRTTWTYSTWIKRTEINSINLLRTIVDGSAPDADDFAIAIDSGIGGTGSYLSLWHYSGSSFPVQVSSSLELNDYANWNNIVYEVDTTQAIAADRIKIYLNGNLINSFTYNSYPTQNQELGFNRMVEHTLGYGYGYMSDIYFIDGQALSFENFGELNGSKWVPKKYEGTYGTNGFHLAFNNSGNLGEDISGNNNDFTVNGAPVQTIDSPENNFAVLDPNNKGPFAVVSGNNLVGTISQGDDRIKGTMRVNISKGGKYYFEVEAIETNYLGFGVGTENLPVDGSFAGEGDKIIFFHDGAIQLFNGSWNVLSSGTTIVNGDKFGFAIDINSNYLSLYRNGILDVSNISINYNLLNGDYLYPVMEISSGAERIPNAQAKFNFGATPFQYSPPTGFNTLSSKYLN